MARFGLLYQRNGAWNGKQIVPEDWIEKSTRAHSIFDREWGIGYGYMWYVLPEEMGYGRAFLHTGVGVHMLAVFPELKLVMVHRVDTDHEYVTTSENLSRLLDLILSARSED
jgi:CubicO group peptidase (beta-lactamase class C family)